MAQRIADGFGSLGELEDYHYSFVQNGKITLIGQKYVAQPTHNFGHRVAFAGTYALTFDKESHAWERHDFPQLVTEENVAESLFEREGKLYLITYTNFAGLHFKQLYQWENNTFAEVHLTAPDSKTFDEHHRTEVLPASGVTANGETILVAGDDDRNILLYSLTIDGGSATIVEAASITQENNVLGGMPCVSSVHGNQVVISYGVHGCGFRWESSRLFVVDLATKSVRAISVKQDYSELPRYCFTGPNSATVNPATGSWIVAAGSVQVGMSGSEHYGAVWALKNLFETDAEPTWVELPQTVESGENVLDGLDLYTLTKENVTKVQVDDV